ncbi:NADAR family protein [Streptomyces sp. NRRL S-87]|uniref:NADAR family protein n=1 Tax=Streptomyces sp. NRRL S-87 TaxID=1463920 RepID=UPI0004C24152|nr:NADAR family protein [Streptomyces sp. NRRL S-87]
MEKIDKLIEQVNRGEPVKYLAFWGHRPRPDGTLGASCLSQWWSAPFTVGDIGYATAEHWMMAEKARLFDDADALAAVLASRTPAEAKKQGRLVRGFDDAVWERERYRIVVEGSVHKFGSDPALRSFLLGTGGRVLVEASPLDRIWGIGLGVNSPDALVPARWRGLNLLGFALMDAREQLRTAA